MSFLIAPPLVAAHQSSPPPLPYDVCVPLAGHTVEISQSTGGNPLGNPWEDSFGLPLCLGLEREKDMFLLFLLPVVASLSHDSSQPPCLKVATMTWRLICPTQEIGS